MKTSIKATQVLFSIFLLMMGMNGYSQQGADLNFHYEVKNPAYENEQGPVIILDEAHENFHKLQERYQPFARVLRADGFLLKSGKQTITADYLAGCDIFVISDPMNSKKKSAYSGAEIIALKKWVESGGSLCLITDHNPDPPAIAALAAAFGIEVNDGFVFNESPGADQGPIYFKRDDGTLQDHAIVDGRKGHREEITEIVSFTGCAFKAGEDFSPLMILGPDKISYMPKNPAKINRRTPKLNVEGWLQGGTMELGKGRLAFFAEAGMFTAQTIGPQRIKFGMNSPLAPQNAQFLLNVFHWLARII